MTATQNPPGSSNPYGTNLFTVRTPSGSDLHLQTTEESDWYESRRDRYMTDNHFPNVSDLQDLDRLLMFETMNYRWDLWLGQGFDYLYARIDESALATKKKEYSTEIRLIKKSLGIDKEARDKEKGESLADYVENLLLRAKEFGYHRNAQYEVVVTKFYELRSMIMTYDRCDEEERALLDLSYESIFQWIRDSVVKDFDQHSDAFRKNQSIWVRDI